MTSRQELIAWVNGLLQTNYSKVEQLGSGAAYCQILDSIYGDLRLERVKFNANQEYEYVENFKILQNAMTKHKISKPIDPTRLIKCRFQDNFEFLQWLKKHWESYYSGAPYDAVGRRNGKPGGPVDSLRPMSSASSSIGARATAMRPGSRTTGAGAASAQQIQELNRQVADAKVLIETAERERDFYFQKLREIEVFIQQAELEAGSESEKIAKHIQGILYSTDESATDDVDVVQDDEYNQVSGTMGELHIDPEETF
ncbi:hypothetical protein COEREDRAFT_45453 [Coemansia reversa NRRL 1564]|uniref:Microtubule binding protein n=1 Tax=Coemansia reversa (strain ATCC 12441 / NRRL 1564) TaxID=763665 RepID=A0A2G5B7R6_COERN|nr:hypothetical protein COEREDRAFT_45453 [Coemansia reversa NRRL 1564]|eukprot:PIA15041.1 hypothetical protein COEREDRAFT_45453 [Coemansia reversa NRRL 1564]